MDSDALKVKVRELWHKACLFEGVKPESRFVEFSKNNPHVAAYDKAVQKLFKTQKPSK